MRSREWVVGCVDDDPADGDDIDAALVADVVAMVVDPFGDGPVPPSPVMAADIIAKAAARLRHQPGDYTTYEDWELACVERERREAAWVAALRDDWLAHRLRGRRRWFTCTGRGRPTNRGECFA